MTAIVNLSRRRFLGTGAAAASGLILGFHLPAAGRAAEAAPAARTDVNAWLAIAADGTVTIRVAHSEMGQGVLTSLPMIVADEMGADWSMVRAETAPAAPVYRNRLFGVQATGGSTSVRASFEPLRRVGAAARAMLIEAAAARWGVAAADCRAAAGKVIHPGSGRALGFGELAEVAAHLTPPDAPPLKDDSELSLIGRPVPRLDTPPKVDGSAVFGVDVRVPGMLVATVLQSPVFGGTLRTVDPAPALAVKGVVRVLPLDNAVIVVATGTWPAFKGRAALRPAWRDGDNAGNDSAAIHAALAAALEKPAPVAAGHGDARAALAGAARRIEATYEAPFLAHATMEPMNATVAVREGEAEVWAPTQGQEPIQRALAALLGIRPERVIVHTTFLGGGFGRRFETDFVRLAALASKAVGRPVKLVWPREEDIGHDFYRPASTARLSGGLGGDGRPVALTARVASPSIMARVFPGMVKGGIDRSSVEGLNEPPYAIPNLRVEYALTDVGVPVGFWRSVGHSQNAFFLECFIDEMAEAAGADALAFRLALLDRSPRHARVLKAAAEAAGWGRPLPAGRAHGLAVHESFGSVVAEVAEVEVSTAGRLRVVAVACAVDSGRVVNPDTVAAQMESGIVYGLTAALFGEIGIRGGRAEQGNFDTYEMLRLAQMPAIDVRLVPGGGRIGGIGEPATPPIAPAVVNAVFRASGRRIRSLPLTRHGFTAA